MRLRLGAVFVLLTAVLGSLLTGASVAHAGPGDDPICRPSLLRTPDVICTIDPQFDGRELESIRWTKDSDPIAGTNDIRSIRVPCEPGTTFVVGVTVQPTDRATPSVGSMPIT